MAQVLSDELSSTGDDTDSGCRGKKSKGKLTSGKVAKVDDLDIKVQVRYPHSKLNGEFTAIKEFDKLPLNLLAAGDIEVVLHLQNVQEKTARLRCLLVLLYYSQYLDIKDLHDQYDVLLKQVEREEAHWGEALWYKLERALDRRIRVKDQLEYKSATSNMNKVVNTAVGNTTKEKGVRTKEEFIYCAQFNRGTCVEAGTHKGRFAGREGVTLNHACVVQ